METGQPIELGKVIKYEPMSGAVKSPRVLPRCSTLFMKTLLSLLAVAFLTVMAKAQSPILFTNLVASSGFAWDVSPSPGVVGYDIVFTTNQTWITTNTTNALAGVITGVGVPGTFASLLTVWPGVTNGTYSVFVDARDNSGSVSPYSTNVLFRVQIRPQPPKNLRIIQQ